VNKRVVLAVAGAAAVGVIAVIPTLSAGAATSVSVSGTAGPASLGGSGIVNTGMSTTSSVTLTATGTVFGNAAKTQSAGPGGNGSCTSACFKPTLPRLALIGRVGANPWKTVGSGPTTLSGSGQLQLAVNDAAYGDNSGTFTASVTAPTPGQAATSLTMTVSATTITATHTLTLRTRLTRSGAALPNATVALLARPAGATAFKQVTTATTNSSGAASASQRPMHTTAYEWFFAGDKNSAATTSAIKSVSVRTEVTIHVFDPTLGSGQPLVVWGLTRPNKHGMTIRVYRHTSAGNTKLGTATVRRDGTWGFSKRVHSGSATVFARIPAGGGNVAGTSSRLSFSAA
jgi:hypothetical protein